MSYSSFKNIKASFKFSQAFDKKDLPAYAIQYIKSETVLAVYKTERDFGIFTDKKLVLFDNGKNRKQIYTIPYKSISMLSVCFLDDSSELTLFIDSGCSINLMFVDMYPKDKLRLRVLYNCVDKIISGEKPIKEDMESLINNKISL